MLYTKKYGNRVVSRGYIIGQMLAFFYWLDKYAEWIEHLIESHSALSPLLLLLAEEMGIPILIPGDAILAYTGYSVSQSHHTPIWLALGVATMSVLIGATVLFFIARKWGQKLIKHLSKFLFISDRHIQKAELLFAKYGIWAIIFGRHIPGMRIPITIFAATSGVKYKTFILSTFASTVLWILFYLKVGARYGNDIQHTINQSVGLSASVIIGIIFTIISLHFSGAYKQKHRKTKTRP